MSTITPLSCSIRHHRALSFRRLDHEEFSDIVHGHQTDSAPRSESVLYGSRDLRACQHRIQHLRRVAVGHSAHAVTNDSGAPSPGQRLEQIASRQDALDLPVVDDWKVLL